MNQKEKSSIRDVLKIATISILAFIGVYLSAIWILSLTSNYCRDGFRLIKHGEGVIMKKNDSNENCICLQGDLACTTDFDSSSNKDKTKNPDGDSTTINENADETAGNSSNDNSSRRIDINKSGYINIPAGWEINGIGTSYEDITDDIPNHLPCAESCFTGGVWTIFKKFEVDLEKNGSHMRLIREIPFIPGGFGGSAKYLKGDTKVIVEPVGTEGEKPALGFARVKEDEQYRYLLIKKNVQYNPDSNNESNKYKYVNVSDTNFLGYVIYDGNSDHFKEVENFFQTSCLENSSGICWDNGIDKILST
jgi:hypothetical protein